MHSMAIILWGSFIYKWSQRANKKNMTVLKGALMYFCRLMLYYEYQIF